MKDLILGLEREAAAIEDEKKRAAYLKLAQSFQSAKRVRAILDLARTETALLADIDDFDADPMLLNVVNGTIDLRTGELRRHNKADLISKLAPVVFDPDAKAPTFERFLRETFGADEEFIGYVQRTLGYCLTGHTSEQLLLIWNGAGANGKTTLAKAVRNVLGEYATICAPSTIIERRGESITNDVADLVGARLVTTEETERNQRFSQQRIKELTGEGGTKARHLYRDFFQFQPVLKLVLCTNTLPQFDGSDPAMVRRLHVWPFEHVVPEGGRDKTLGDKLKREAPGVLNWLAAGCLEWQRVGLQPPAKVREAVEEYRMSMDRTAQFMEEMCEVNADFRCKATELYNSYRFWCYENGLQPVGAEYLAADLKKKGINKIRSNGVRFVGVRLRNTVGTAVEH